MTFESFLNEERKEEYFKVIEDFINEPDICPKKDDVFRALTLTPLDKVYMVILGQDPYYIKDMADGLAFSTRMKKIPKSLQNIFKELYIEYGYKNTSGDLSSWAKQGVLLLNTTLTTIVGSALAHKHPSYQILTDKIIKLVSDSKKNIVFLLLGEKAKRKCELIDKERHLIITSAHPSPLSSKKFFNNNQFIRANEYLMLHHNLTIDFRT